MADAGAVDDLLRLRLTRDAGVIDSAALARLGLDGYAVRRLVRRGELVRVRAGAFVDGRVWSDADPYARHVLTARAMLRRLDGYAASPTTALALWGLPVLNADLATIHAAPVVRGRPRSAGTLRVHPPVARADVVAHLDAAVVTPELAVLQAAGLSIRADLVAADAGVRAALLTQEGLRSEAQRQRVGYAARRIADLVSARSESPGESWTRLVLAGLGIEAEQQVEIMDADGRFVARVDFLVRSQRLVVEFDGAVKYDGADGREALVRETRREDALRALGHRVVRLTWADLHHPDRVLALLQGTQTRSA